MTVEAGEFPVTPGSKTAVPPAPKRGKRRGEYRIPPPPGDRCSAIVFLSAVGLPQRCRYRRRRALYCHRHWRERGNFAPD